MIAWNSEIECSNIEYDFVFEIYLDYQELLSEIGWSVLHWLIKSFYSLLKLQRCWWWFVLCTRYLSPIFPGTDPKVSEIVAIFQLGHTFLVRPLTKIGPKEIFQIRAIFSQIPYQKYKLKYLEHADRSRAQLWGIRIFMCK